MTIVSGDIMKNLPRPEVAGTRAGNAICYPCPACPAATTIVYKYAEGFFQGDAGRQLHLLQETVHGSHPRRAPEKATGIHRPDIPVRAGCGGNISRGRRSIVKP